MKKKKQKHKKTRRAELEEELCVGGNRKGKPRWVLWKLYHIYKAVGEEGWALWQINRQNDGDRIGKSGSTLWRETVPGRRHPNWSIVETCLFWVWESHRDFKLFLSRPMFILNALYCFRHPLVWYWAELGDFCALYSTEKGMRRTSQCITVSEIMGQNGTAVHRHNV